MKKHLQKLTLPLLFTLALMLACMMGMAQTAYITNIYDGTVSVINVATNTVIDIIKVGANPHGVSVSADGTKVYIANGGDSTVSVINTNTNTVSAIIPVGSGPWGLSVSPNGSKVYVTNNYGNTVNVINTVTNTVAATITVGYFPYGIAVSPDGRKVYVANGSNSTVSVINANADSISANIPIHNFLMGLSVNPDGSKVYVANNDTNSISVIDTTTNAVSTRIIVGYEPSCVSVSPDGSKVYVTNYDSVSVINTATNTVLKTIKAGTSPFGVSVSPDGSKVYVANSGDNTVSVINTLTNTVSATIPVGNYPVAFGNFISTYTAPFCNANFSITADTTQLHHYIATDNSYGRQPIKYVWSWGDGSQDTIPYPSHTYVDSGFYNICLSITDSAGCQSTFCDSSFHALRTTNTMVYVDVFNPLTTGTQVINSPTPQVTIYPNPFTSQTTIAFSEEQRNTTITITDLLGKEIKTIPHVRDRQIVIDKGEMSSGIYFVQITDEKGRMVNKKIVVQ